MMKVEDKAASGGQNRKLCSALCEMGLHMPCADGVVVIAISLYPEVPGSIQKTRMFVHAHAVHLLSFLRRSDSPRGDNLALASHPRMGKSHIGLLHPASTMSSLNNLL